MSRSATQDFASTSVARHVARGAVGFGAVAGAIVLLPVHWIFAVVLLPVALVAFRGCPTCWVVGLVQTVSRGRLQRSCDTEGRCTIVPREKTPV